MTRLRLALPGAMRPALLALQRQWQASALPRFLSWWGRQLAACLPARLRKRLARRDAPPRLRWAEGRLWRLFPTGWQPWAPSGHADPPGVLLLGQGQALARPLSFPAAAAADLEGAVTFEMNRYTPFSADELYWDLKRLPGKPHAPVQVLLGVARRDRLQALLDELDEHGVRLQAVDVAAPAEGPGDAPGLGLNLLPAHRRAAAQGRQRQANAVLAVLVLCLAVAALQLWLYNRGAALEAMQHEVAAVREAAAEVQQLRQTLQLGVGASQYLAERRRGSPPLSLVLSELTHCLPRDTWLNQFDLQADGQLSLAGQSEHAAELIARIKSCPSVTAAQLQGVIQPDETSGRERFYLLARLRKEERHDAPVAVTP